MNANAIHGPGRSLLSILALGAACLCAVPPARAGLTINLQWYHDANGYLSYPWLSTNTTPPNNPLGEYFIVSPQPNGWSMQYQATSNSFSFVGGGGWYYPAFDSFIQAVTNGPWSIWVTNSTSTNQYQFTVSVSGVTSNVFGAPAAPGFPTDGAQYVTNQPLFAWTGPANWAGTLYVDDVYIDNNGNWNGEAGAYLPASQTTWACPVVLPDGTNQFSVSYLSNVTASIVASTPRNGAAQPISGWVSTATLESDFASSPQFIVGQAPSVTNAGHRLVAHYPFDNSNYLAQDTSGNGNDLGGGSWWGPQTQFSTNAEAGGGAVQFFGTSALTPSDTTRAHWDETLAGSFSMSAWVKTTASRGNNSDDALAGATIFWAYNDGGNTNDTIPLAITGSKAAFSTRDHLGNSTTLHSISSVNNGAYHLITVTRDSANGEKQIYIDGNFEATEAGTTDPLNGNNYFLALGGSTSSSFTGLLDDVQIYAGVLSATEIGALYSQPGSTSPDVSTINFNPALNTSGLPWSTGGDSDWRVETTNTFDGVSAAQSGSVTGAQTSTLSVAVTGPGFLSFYWASIANDTNGGFDYEFDIDGNYADDLSGDNDWYQDGTFTIGGGVHRLSWTVYAGNDTDPTQAGFLDEVSYVAASPVALLHPQNNGTNFQFQFASQSGFTHAIQYRTNLLGGTGWQTFSTVAGDGSLKTIPIPLSVFGRSQQGFVRVSTQ
jgi:hypothetical protein